MLRRGVLGEYHLHAAFESHETTNAVSCQLHLSVQHIFYAHDSLQSNYDTRNQLQLP